MNNMFWKNITIILRRFSKNKGFALINILGLSISIAAALVILMILRFDLSFDNYHDDVDRIFRLVKLEKINGEIDFDAGIPYPLRKKFKEEYEEIEYLVMVDGNNSGSIVEVEFNNKVVRHDEDGEAMAYVMPDYFRLFNYDFIAGNAENPLNRTNTIVITKRLAEKYFNNYADALDQTIRMDDRQDFLVTGVVSDPPENSDFQFSMFVSFATGGEERVWDSWTATSSSSQVFIKTKPAVDITNFENNIKNYIEDKKGEGVVTEFELRLQPLSELHHNADYFTYTQRTATYEEMFTLSAIAILILIAASINFINLNIALAFKRSKEIGVRKVLGGGRGKLIVQFLTETGLITFISMVVAIGLAELVALQIDYIIGYSLPSISYDFLLVIILISLFCVVTLLSGLYPALVISGFKPVQALKNKISGQGRSNISLRKSLIVVQLVISQVLVVAVIVVSKQINHFLNQPMGIDTEAVVELSLPGSENNTNESFKDQTASLAGIKDVTLSNTGTASEDTWSGFGRMTVNEEPITFPTHVKIIDTNYLQTYGLRLLAGRNVKAVKDSIRYYLVNEKLVKKMGLENLEDAIGMDFRLWGVDGKVIGVVADYHTVSLHHEVQPVAMWYNDSQRKRLAIKLQGAEWRETLSEIEELWHQTYPDYTFSYQFLDDQLAQFYRDEQRLSRTFTLFAMVALFIGAIGLLGLMSYMVATRTKEIGVRKVLGAKVIQLVQLLSSDFISMVAIAFLFTVPISWYFMSQWLQDFASRIDLSIWIFISALSFSLIITLLTVGYQSVRAAYSNPVDSLKDE